MSDLLDNAVDSIQMGLSHYLNPKLEKRDKWAILALFHAIELLLKERLWTEDPNLIYRDPADANPNAFTISFQEALKRFKDSDIELPPEQVAILKDLQRRRNQIEHHRFVPDPSHRLVLGEALKFIGNFLEDQLDENLEDHLSPEMFHEARELMLDYERLVRKAKADMKVARSRFSPKEQSLFDTAWCPECGNDTVLIGIDGDKRCYYCNEDDVDLQMCSECGQYRPSAEFSDMSICSDCFSYKVSRD